MTHEKTWVVFVGGDLNEGRILHIEVSARSQEEAEKSALEKVYVVNCFEKAEDIKK